MSASRFRLAPSSPMPLRSSLSSRQQRRSLLQADGIGVPIGSAAQAAQALVPFLGIFASRAFAVGMLGAALLAAGVLPLSTSYSLAEAFGFERGVSRPGKKLPSSGGCLPC